MSVATDIQDLRRDLRKLEDKQVTQGQDQVALKVNYKHIQSHLGQIEEGIKFYSRKVFIGLWGLFTTVVALFITLFMSGKIVIG